VSALVFSRNENGLWFEREKLVASDRHHSDNFGTWVSISASDIFVGSGNGFNELGQDSLFKAGAVYNFSSCIGKAEISELECDSFYWPLNLQTYYSSGVYYDTNTNFGCDSIVILDLSIVSQDPNIGFFGFSGLAAIDSTGSFQWWNCDSNQLVSEATSQTFLPTINGSYSVISNREGCIDTSECLHIGNVGIDLIEGSSFDFYPNPSESLIIVEFSETIDNATLELFDATGNLVFNRRIINEHRLELTLPMVAGVYLLHLRNETGHSSYKKGLKY